MYWFYFTLFSFVNEIHTFNVSVKVKQGIILGKSLTTVFNEIIYFAFYAVPYAQPPIGKLRFKNPKRIKNWRRPYDATLEYHGACAQEHIVHKSTVYGTEDCLYLNIFTPKIPASGKSKPVLKSVIVWIHGYAFTTSLSHVHGPDFLIENDVIVVTLSHRLGAFGFAKINQSDSHANMGLKDIVLGLQWLHKNIESFGGDKNKITVVGSGSASSYISLLLVTKYKKLFSKIILQSGSIYSPSMFQGNETYEKLKLDTALKKQGYKNILEASTKDIIEASRKIYSRIDTINIQRPIIPFLPLKELESRQSLLTLSPAEIYADIENKNINKPVLLGYASQEGISEMIPFIHNPHHLNLFSVLFKYMVPFVNGCRYKHTSKTYNIIGNKIKHNYIKNGILENAVSNFMKLSSDLQKYSIFKFIKSQLRDINNKLYVYNFNYIGKLNVVKATSMANAKAVIKGAAQGDEICYLFNCEPQGEIYFQLKFTPDNVDIILIKEISQMWANFAKYSDPNLDKKDSVKWLPMTANRDYVFRFGKTNKLTNSKNEQKMVKFWDEIYDQFYSDKNCNRLRDEL